MPKDRCGLSRNLSSAVAIENGVIVIDPDSLIADPIDPITTILARLLYDTSKRTSLTPEAVGLAGESATVIKRIELLSEDPEGFFRVVFAQVKSLTAKIRNDLVRVLSKGNQDHLLILASDYDALEFVFLDKRKREQKGPGTSERIPCAAQCSWVPCTHDRSALMPCATMCGRPTGS